MPWRSYWLSFTTTTVAAGLLAVAGAASLGPRAARPALPDFARSFPSEYSAAGWDTTHDIYFHGLFGVGTRLRDADLFLLGSSHVEFGLSAAGLGRLLAKEGRKPQVYNLGLGCGETTGFALEILQQNRVTNRAAIAEAGTLLEPGPRQCGQRSAGFDTVQAYAAVLKIWSRYLYDWALDPIVPRLLVDTNGAHLRRFLFGLVTERSWATGDVVLGWHPLDGEFYPGEPQRPAEISTAAQRLGLDWQFGNGQIAVSEALRQQAAAIGLDLAVTAVPWAADTPHFNKPLHQAATHIQPDATAATRCFIAIPLDGLTSWDNGNHLTQPSRDVATERLAAGLQDTHCLKLASDARPERP